MGRGWGASNERSMSYPVRRRMYINGQPYGNFLPPTLRIMYDGSMDNLKERFTQYTPNYVDIAKIKTVRNAALDLANTLNDLVPKGREKSLAITHLEEVVMWANKAIASASVPDTRSTSNTFDGKF